MSGLSEEEERQLAEELEGKKAEPTPPPTPAPAPPSPASTSVLPPRQPAPAPPSSPSSLSSHAPSPTDYAFLHNMKRSWQRLEAYLDDELRNTPVFSLVHSKVGLHPSHVFIGLVVLGFLMVTFNMAHRLICNGIGFVYPAMRSWQALGHKSAENNSHWLVYWTVFGLLHILEYFESILVWCFPTWFIVKYLFLLWATVPFTGANEIIYNHVWRRIDTVRRFLSEKQP